MLPNNLLNVSNSFSKPSFSELFEELLMHDKDFEIAFDPFCKINLANSKDSLIKLFPLSILFTNPILYASFESIIFNGYLEIPLRESQ